MTIQINTTEIEALIRQRLDTGGFKDAEDVVLHALRTSPEPPMVVKPPMQQERSLREVFESIRGMADDLDFHRNPSTGRPANLS